MNFAVHLLFLIKSFFLGTWPKSHDKILNILRMIRAFKMYAIFENNADMIKLALFLENMSMIKKKVLWPNIIALEVS